MAIKKKKKFFEIELPLINKSSALYSYDLQSLNNRYIAYDLTRALRGKGLEIKFKVIVENNQIRSVPRQLRLVSYFLRRMIRKGTNYVEDSFSIKCKDAQLRVKPFLITRKKVSRAVRNALRIKAKEEISNYIEKKDVNQIFDDILKNKLQKELSLKLKKIYPLSLCEIRVIKIEKDI